MPAASSIDTGFAYQLRTDIDTGGSFDLWEAFFDGVFDVDLTRRFGVVTHFDYRADVYGFADTPSVQGQSLTQWGLVHTPRLEPLLAYRVGDQWRIYLGPVGEFSFESGADMSDAFRAGGLLAVEYAVSDRLRVGLGVLGVNNIGVGPWIQPVLILDWAITDALSLHVESWDTRGGEADLSWRFGEQFELAGVVGYRHEEFRLTERVVTPLPNIKIPIHVSEGIAEDGRFTAALRFSWLPRFELFRNVMGDARLDVFVDSALAGRLTIRDRNGAPLSVTDYGPTPSFGFAVYVPLPR